MRGVIQFNRCDRCFKPFNPARYGGVAQKVADEVSIEMVAVADEEWEVCASIYNETYLYSASQNAFAYFINNGTAFYFTNYFGSKKTLLFAFYEAAYKVLLSSEKQINVKDHFPLNVFSVNPIKWLQDLLAPFYIFIRMRYESEVKQNDGLLNSGSISFNSKQTLELFGIGTQQSTATVNIQNGQLQSFIIQTNKQTIQAVCSN